MIKREIKRFRNKVGKYMDPLAIIAMILVLLLPALTVINLSPLSKSNVKTNKNVLGEAVGKDLGFVLVGGVHDYIKEELLDFPSEDTYQYVATIIKHNPGRYSKPIVQIVNENSQEQAVTVSALMATTSNTEVSIIVNEKEYRLVSSEGEPYTTSIVLPSKSENIMYLKLVTQTPTLFNNNIELQFVQR
ncbi:hypothetical protein HYV12_04175 [Candidatus Dojkabacteria bacterium]|nr:hypothetical protein [Candidatus Dojkabacteria bacterium]